MMATVGLLVPKMSSDFSVHGTTATQVEIRRLTSVFAVLATVAVLFANTIGPWALATILPAYAGATMLILPISLQTAFYLVQIPYSAMLRAARKARSLALSSLALAMTSVLGALVGSFAMGLVGAAWGLVIAAAINCVIVIRLGTRTIRTDTSNPNSSSP
jgi:O-antigen/teichoic acid export membrane protein